MTRSAQICVLFSLFLFSVTAGAMLGWALHKQPSVANYSDHPPTYAWARLQYLGLNEYAPR